MKSSNLLLAFTLIILKSLQDTEALECISCISIESESVEDMPGIWGNLKSTSNTSCKHSPNPIFTTPCGQMNVDPAFKFRSCGKVTFAFRNITLWLEMTWRGCMATAKNLSDGYCEDMTFEKLMNFPSVGDSFRELMQEFPPSTCANICSCNSTKCNMTNNGTAADNKRFLDYDNACAVNSGGNGDIGTSIWLCGSLEKSILWNIVSLILWKVK